MDWTLRDGFFHEQMEYLHNTLYNLKAKLDNLYNHYIAERNELLRKFSLINHLYAEYVIDDIDNELETINDYYHAEKNLVLEDIQEIEEEIEALALDD